MEYLGQSTTSAHLVSTEDLFAASDDYGWLDGAESADSDIEVGIGEVATTSHKTQAKKALLSIPGAYHGMSQGQTTGTGFQSYYQDLAPASLHVGGVDDNMVDYFQKPSVSNSMHAVSLEKQETASIFENGSHKTAAHDSDVFAPARLAPHNFQTINQSASKENPLLQSRPGTTGRQVDRVVLGNLNIDTGSQRNETGSASKPLFPPPIDAPYLLSPAPFGAVKRPSSPSFSAQPNRNKRAHLSSPPLSPEQIKILHRATELAGRAAAPYSDGSTLIISGTRGTGKTRTAIEIVAALRHIKRTLVVTAQPSSLCREDLQQRFCDAGCFYATVHNARSLAKLTPTEFPLVVLEEWQECNSELFKLVHSFIGSNTFIVLVGTKGLASFEFMDGDSRYLELATQIFEPRRCEEIQLTTNFRITQANAAFLNNVYLMDPKIIAYRDGPPPTYLYGNVWDPAPLVKFALPLIQHFGPENCAVITPSLRRMDMKPAGRFNNALTKAGVPVMEAGSDDGPVTMAHLKGKVAVGTPHRFQGMEFKAVFVFGIEESYYKWYGRRENRDLCPAAVNVALTLASEKLVIVHNTAFQAMQFVQTNLLRVYSLLKPVTKGAKPIPKRGEPSPSTIYPKKVTASELPMGLPPEFLKMLLEKYRVRFHIVSLPPRDRVRIRPPLTVYTVAPCAEPVADLNAVIVTADFEFHRYNTTTTINGAAADFPPSVKEDLPRLVDALTRTAVKHSAERSGLTQRQTALQQVEDPYHWPEEFLEEARHRLKNRFTPEEILEFEVELPSYKLAIGGGMVEIIGRADIIAENSKGEKSGWEIKFREQLLDSDAIQLVIYGILMAHKEGQGELPRLSLFNIGDGELLQIEVSLEDAENLLRELIRYKYGPRAKSNDAEFVAAQRRITIAGRWSKPARRF